MLATDLIGDREDWFTLKQDLRPKQVRKDSSAGTEPSIVTGRRVSFGRKTIFKLAKGWELISRRRASTAEGGSVQSSPLFSKIVFSGVSLPPKETLSIKNPADRLEKGKCMRIRISFSKFFVFSFFGALAFPNRSLGQAQVSYASGIPCITVEEDETISGTTYNSDGTITDSQPLTGYGSLLFCPGTCASSYLTHLNLVENYGLYKGVTITCAVNAMFSDPPYTPVFPGSTGTTYNVTRAAYTYTCTSNGGGVAQGFECLELAGPAGQISLNVSTVHFDQVVQDPQLPSSAGGTFDAVAGKSASFQIQLTGANLTSAAANDSVTVKVFNSNCQPVATTTCQPLSVSNPIPISVIAAAGGSYTITPDQMATYIPKPSDSGQVTVHIDTSNAHDITATDYTGMSLNVEQVTLPKVGFAQIAEPAICVSPTCYPAASPTASDTAAILNTDSFTSSIYPVPDDSILYSPVISSIAGSNPGSFPVISFPPSTIDPRLTNSMMADLNQMEVTRKLLGLDRIVGIVPTTYFPAHGRPAYWTGFTPYSTISPLSNPTANLPMKSVWVREDTPIATPHELAHSFGVAYKDSFRPQEHMAAKILV